MHTKKKYDPDNPPEHLTELAQAHRASGELIRNYLMKPAKEMEANGHSPIEIASAYMMLTHLILHNHYPKDKIDEAYAALSFWAKKHIEKSAKQKKAQKSKAIH